jgi:hypothetical protein
MATDTVGEIIQFAMGSNFLKMVSEQPGLGDHHVGAVLVYKGQILGEDNIFRDVAHIAQHQQSSIASDSDVPVCLRNLLTEVGEAAKDKQSGHALGRVAACIRECLKELQGKRLDYYVFDSLFRILFLTALFCTTGELEDTFDKLLEAFRWNSHSGFKKAPVYGRLYSQVIYHNTATSTYQRLL